MRNSDENWSAGVERLDFQLVWILSYRYEKNPRHQHAGGGRYGNGISHCILGVKERVLFHLAQIEPAEVSFRFVLRSKTNSSPNELRLVCQMLRSILRLVYLRQQLCSGFFSCR
ncbi:hypothetical protein AVEN_133728-1 [Araneus ventricosus]|uniref:Uncharacterized protein n=1 Tax=Araneus ventricosus TaxID=182803 RepID=A0A4Y2B8H4_ARAVE|nr:hypothetical protein AVEN_133728-1 [Araneus ventricosus]